MVNTAWSRASGSEKLLILKKRLHGFLLKHGHVDGSEKVLKGRK